MIYQFEVVEVTTTRGVIEADDKKEAIDILLEDAWFYADKPVEEKFINLFEVED